jgi:hypothetical protein
MDDPLSYAVRDFYLNGGSQAIIVRLFKSPAGTSGKATLDVDTLKLEAVSAGDWGNKLQVTLDYDGITAGSAKRYESYDLTADDLFNLTVTDKSRASGSEKLRNLSLKDGPRRVDRVLEEESQLVHLRRNPDGTPILPNPLGINCLRNFHLAGCVVWGARTLCGADPLAGEYKYVPVRRTALFIAETLYRALQWVVFEPNDEPLWAQIRLNVGALMHGLFRQGAFQGTTPRDAYFVQCDPETTTRNDINQGIVNILVGFAPLKAAEFVIIKIRQMAGQIPT